MDLYFRLNNGEKFITTTQLFSRIQSLNKKVVHFVGEENDDETIDDEEDLFNTTFVKEDEDGESCRNVPLNETFTFPHNNRSQESTENKNDGDIKTNNRNNPFPHYLNQEGVKLTLEDLLKCASNFNAGESPKPAIDRSNKDMMGRNIWKFGSQFNFFILQLLLLCLITQSITINEFVLLVAAFLSLWSCFNLLGLKKRHLNFKGENIFIRKQLLQLHRQVFF
jgi:hypothetical protein